MTGQVVLKQTVRKTTNVISVHIFIKNTIPWPKLSDKGYSLQDKYTMFIKELLNEMPAAGNFRNRMWYHGTNKRAFNKILQTKLVKPYIADHYEAGAAIWLTSDPEQALEFGQIILAIPNKLASKYEVERWSGYPHGFRKKFDITTPTTYNMIIKSAVPLKYWKLYNPKTGNLENIL